jgi:hypothetical protein
MAIRNLLTTSTPMQKHFYEEKMYIYTFIAITLFIFLISFIIVCETLIKLIFTNNF